MRTKLQLIFRLHLGVLLLAVIYGEASVAMPQSVPSQQLPVATPTPVNPNANQPEVQDRAQVLEEMRSAGVADPGENERTLNLEGYEFMYDQKDIKKAIRNFRWNLVLFAKTRYEWSLQDSMAEAYLQSGDVENAVKHYEMSYSLMTPQIPAKYKEHVKSMLDRLKDPASLSILQEELRLADEQSRKSRKSQ
jgi:hypothetical protein